MIHFKPRFVLTQRIKKDLLFIEKVREKFSHLPIAPRKPILRKEERYLTYIENITTDDPGIANYLQAYNAIIEWKERPITEDLIKRLHSIILGKRRATPYRRGQNAVYDANLEQILYLPPKAKDVGPLMKELVQWIQTSSYACPITAAIAHFGINSIHPYYDGNGRTARLLTKLVLNKGGYGMQNLLQLENYYLKDLDAYYDVLSLSRNSLTMWVEYFCKGMAYSCKQALKDIAT